VSDNNCQQTPIVDLLRSVPKDFRGTWPIQWAEDGSETGHALSPVGRLAHDAADELEALQRRVEELESLNEWKVCDENTPIDTELLLGWVQTWPSEKWESQISVYHCTRGRWIHGSATHYMSVPRAAVVLNSTKEPA